MRPIVPELRFPEFKGPWKPARAGDAFRKSKAKGEAGLPIYSVTQDRGLVRRDSLERHMGADAADEANLRAQPGDLVYNMMRMWQGAVGMASEECMVSPAYVVLSPKKGVSSKFFDYWFQNRHMLHQLWAYSHGLTNDRLRLYYQDFAKIPLALPDQPEQEKIAAVLDTTSRKIALLTDKKTALEDYKRGLMQRLFSRELRFTRDDGSAFPDWEERELRKAATINPESEGLPREFEYIDLECVNSGVVGFTQRLSRAEAPSRAQRVLRKQDVLFQLVRPYQRNNLIFRRDGNYVASTGYAQIRAKSEPHYLFQVMHTDEFVREVMRRSTGTGYPAITPSELGKIKIPFPHLDEQRKIASALSALDAKIDALSQKISEMEAFKKGLLQKLFV